MQRVSYSVEVVGGVETHLLVYVDVVWHCHSGCNTFLGCTFILCAEYVCIYLHDRVCLEPRLQIWVQAAGAWRALCSCCTEVGG